LSEITKALYISELIANCFCDMLGDEHDSARKYRFSVYLMA